MTVLLQILIDYAWGLYFLCAAGAIAYVVRALMAHRERSLAQFTLERETATSRLVQAWAMVLVFVALGAIVFFSTTFVLPSYGLDSPEPTPAAGLDPPTLTPTPAPVPASPVPTVMPTVDVPTSPPPDTPAPTEAPPGALSGELNVRFGDFAELVGYSLPAAEVTAGQPVQLTLYWRALEARSAVDYVVFTHLVPAEGDAFMIAQHDGQPAGGARPMSGWTPGEVIEDVHPMAFVDPSYTGQARINVGLYRGDDRVLTEAGETHIFLPVSVNVVAP